MKALSPPLFITSALFFLMACEKSPDMHDLQFKATINSTEWSATDVYSSYTRQNQKMLILGSKRPTSTLPEERLAFEFLVPTLTDSLTVESFETTLEIIGTDLQPIRYEKFDSDTIKNYLYITTVDTINHILEGGFSVTVNTKKPASGEQQNISFSQGHFKIRYEIK